MKEIDQNMATIKLQIMQELEKAVDNILESHQYNKEVRRPDPMNEIPVQFTANLNLNFNGKWIMSISNQTTVNFR